MAELVRGIIDSQRMSCPRQYGPGADLAHLVVTRVQSIAYKASKPFRDEVGDLPEDNAAVAAIDLAIHDPELNKMVLMKDTVSFFDGGPVRVDTYWWECHLCGFILPCTAVR